MDCLLISGYPRTGKNLTTIRIAHFLLGIGYRYFAGDPVPTGGATDDFTTVLQHSDSLRRIVVNSRSDYATDGDRLANFYRNQEPINVLITTIRDAGVERQAMENAIGLLQPLTQVEIPLARIIGQRQDWQAALDAYIERVEKLARFILRGLPFQV